MKLYKLNIPRNKIPSAKFVWVIQRFVDFNVRFPSFHDAPRLWHGTHLVGSSASFTLHRLPSSSNFFCHVQICTACWCNFSEFSHKRKLYTFLRQCSSIFKHTKRLFFSSGWGSYTWKEEKKHQTLNIKKIELFLHMLIKFDIICMRIGH